MNNFFTFYKNLETIPNPFQIFSLFHFGCLLLTAGTILFLFSKYKECDEQTRMKWQHRTGWFLFSLEMLLYMWIWFNCGEFLEVLHLELCTVCLFLDFSTNFHKSKQVRFFGAVIGFLGAPIALIYPATIADIYPQAAYIVLTFFLTHGTYILFALMFLDDPELLTQKRLINNLIIVACLLTAVYFFDKRFGTQYMFVGTPPQIPIIRMVYDFVGPVLFLPIAIIILDTYQCLIYCAVKKIQKITY